MTRPVLAAVPALPPAESTTPPQAGGQPERFLTVAQLEATGIGSNSGIRQWITRGLLPHVKIGSAIRVRASDWAAFIADHTRRGGGP